jgi:phosphate transport system permease protein
VDTFHKDYGKKGLLGYMKDSFQRDEYNSSDQKLHSKSINLNSSSGINNWFDKGFTWVVYASVAVTVLILFLMIWVIFQDAKPAIDRFGLSFLWSQNWDISNHIFGALPYIYGSLVSSLIGILFAFPIGIAVALVTSENFLPTPAKVTLGFVIELISAIPSVIVGLWGVFVFIPFFLPLQKWLSITFKWIPLFNTEDPSGTNMLSAGIILAIMLVPTIAAISRDILLVIPKELRSASMALGCNRWETIFWTLLPAGFSGIVGATILALGRALGETIAVSMVIGNSTQISKSLLDPAYTIPSILADQFAEAESGLHIGALNYLGLIEFGLTLIVNILAVFLIQWFSKKNQ